MTNQDFSIQLQSTPTETGFDILAITAGEAKGHEITFGADVLQASLSLWDNKPVNIDHPAFFSGPSLRNLAGSVSDAQWDQFHQGIRMQLTPAGPAADVLMQVRDAARNNPAIMQAVGFSAWIVLSLDKDRNVTQIKDVRGVDAVIDPARGGKFLQSLSSVLNREQDKSASQSDATNPPGIKGDNHMPQETPNPTGSGAADQAPETQLAARIAANNQASASLADEQARIAALELQANESEKILIAQCDHLLTSGLAASRLPEKTQARLRRSFEGRAFKAAELTAAIEEAREEVTALTSRQIILGPGRTSEMFNSDDSIRAAAFDMFGAPRDPGTESLKVARLSGIRELYLMLTGDHGFTGAVNLEDLLVGLATTTNFPAIVKDSMNKILVRAWEKYGEAGYGWWKEIVSIEHFNDLNTVDWVITGTIGSLPEVSERGEYTSLPIGDNVETSDWTKYGGYVPLTIEAILRDNLQAFKIFPDELARAGIRNVSEQVAAIFTDNSAVGPTLADTGALFNSTAVTTAGGHANLLTTALGADYTAWNAIALAMYDQPMHVAGTLEGTSYLGTGKKQAINPAYCLVPRALTAQAESLFVPRWESNVSAIPSLGGISYMGKVKVLTVPEWTDANDYAAVADPSLLPNIMLGEIFGVQPQIFVAGRENDPAMFMNDETRLKVRQFLAVGVANYRGLHKSNV